MKKTICLFLCVWNLSSAVGAPSASEPADATPSKRFGAYLSSLGDPTIGFLSINAAFDWTTDWRFSVGLGEMLGTSVGFGVKRLMFPGYLVRPFVGISVNGVYSSFGGDLANAIFGTTTPVTPEWYGRLGFSFGVDWKASVGANLGLGATFWLASRGHAFLPFVNVGWFF